MLHRDVIAEIARRLPRRTQRDVSHRKHREHYEEHEQQTPDVQSPSFDIDF